MSIKEFIQSLWHCQLKDCGKQMGVDKSPMALSWPSCASMPGSTGCQRSSWLPRLGWGLAFAQHEMGCRDGKLSQKLVDSTILLNRLGMLGIKNYKKPFCLYQNHVRSGHPMAPSTPNPNLANEDWPRRSGMESPASQKMGNYGWWYLGKFLHKLKGGNSIEIHKIPKAVLVGCCSGFNLQAPGMGWNGGVRSWYMLLSAK